jgi:hypothetical protein
MASLFKKLINPLEKMAKNEINSLINKAENALLGAVSNSLGRLGLSSKSKSKILASLGDSILSGIASEFFGGFSGEVNRLSKRQIIENTGFNGAGGGDANTDKLKLGNAPASMSNKAFATHVYPADLGKYYVAFQFREYKRPSPSEPVKPFPGASIALPLPKNLLDTHDIGYSTGATGFAGSILNAISDDGTTYNTAVAGAAAYGLEAGAGFLGDDFKAVLQQTLGARTNPNMAVTFDAPKLRTHKFSWTFAPNNVDESNRIRDIIRTFKANALPNFLADGVTAVLTYPKMCQIVLYPWASTDWSKESGYKDSYMYVFKTCMIESVSVDYAPDALVFFNTGDKQKAPGFIKLDISLTEIEYFTAQDFGVKLGSSETALNDMYEKGKSVVDNVLDKASADLTTKTTIPVSAQNNANSSIPGA